MEEVCYDKVLEQIKAGHQVLGVHVCLHLCLHVCVCVYVRVCVPPSVIINHSLKVTCLKDCLFMYKFP